MTTKLVDLPSDQLIGCWHNRRSQATEAEAEMHRLRDEADEISGMLYERGYRLRSGEWIRNP